MADRTIKPDDTNDLVLQNNDGSAKLELNEDQTVKVTTGSDAGEDFTINTSQLVVEGDTGNVGIGNTVPQGKLTISEASGNNAPSTITSANTYLHLGSGDFGPSSNGKFMIGFGFISGATNTNSPAYIGYEESSTSGQTKGDLTFLTRDVTTDTAPTERMRINSSGNVGIGTDNPSSSKLEVHNSGRTLDVYRTTTSNTSMLIAGYSDYGVTKNLVFEVWTSGSVYNDTGVYTTFPSDERLKTEIKETSSKLDKLLQIPIKSYYTTKNPEFKKMGVIAQDLEKVMPSLVDFVNVDETTPMVQKDDEGQLLLNDEGKPYVLDKNGDKLSKIKYTKDSLLLFCAIKAIQELSAKVTALENA